MNDTNAVALDPPTRAERFFGGIAYLSWWSPLGYLAPLVLYFWKGKTSRFIGFHAVQSTMLGLTCLVSWCSASVVSAMVFGVSDPPQVLMTLGGALPVVASLGTALAIFLGRRTALPLLERWAGRIITPLEDRARTDTSTSAIVVPGSPDERIHAGIAYLSTTFPPFIWYPLALYFWKGRHQRFIGFHAVQSILLVAVVITVTCGNALLAFMVRMWMAPRFPSMKRYISVVEFGASALASWLPVLMIIGMGIYVMRGGRGVLPLLGRLAKLIIGTTRPAEQGTQQSS